MLAVTHNLRSIAMALCFTAPLAFAEGEPSALSASAAAELLYQIENLQLEVQSLRGTVEQQQHELSKMKASQRDRYIDLDKRISSLMRVVQERPVVPVVALDVTAASSDALPVDSATSNSVVEPEPVEVVNTPRIIEPANAETLAEYKAAYSLVRNNENAKAELAFVDFIGKYPNSELSGNSYYWLGLLKLNSGDPVSAIEQFKSVIAQFPGHDKETDTLYRLGFAYLKLDDKESARGYLVDVIERFPNSKAAKLAKNLLSNIK
ncbi:hypothetical protein OA92_07865 [Marinomonas sp. SBI22]|nr:hypothetical protein TW85_24465 [Marinomonas sp. S3726]KZM43602.1 hypothetical protein OA92_07865 [Marinomonas sp. SBI22]KZM47164.1 hypothetical protein OA91_01245 [Marinomonas sp. SBI8L]